MQAWETRAHVSGEVLEYLSPDDQGGRRGVWSPVGPGHAPVGLRHAPVGLGQAPRFERRVLKIRVYVIL